MDVVVYIALVLGAGLVGAGICAYVMRRKPAAPDNSSLLLLQNQLSGLTATLTQSIETRLGGMETKIGEGSQQMFDHLRKQFNASTELVTGIRDTVHKQITEVAQDVARAGESTKQVLIVAEQLQNLERVLKNQKQRGNLGEAGLELILTNVLPPGAFRMQYKFGSGKTVDAAIMAKEGIIPIDAKFPLENYLRIVDETDDAKRGQFEQLFKTDLKNRIDETAEYVRPHEGTLTFAFMFIPAEAIYYDLLVNEVGAVKVNTRSLLDYAIEKKVIIVSPTTFSAYLQSVLYGFKAFKVEEAARDIAKNVEMLSRHLKAYEEFFTKLGASLSATVNHYNDAAGQLRMVDKDVLKITGEKAGFELTQVERPQLAAAE